MSFIGTINKMESVLGTPIQYYLTTDTNFMNVNSLLDKHISITHIGYQCLNCHKVKKIFAQGFCYDCFTTSPAAADWIMHPELSKAHLDIEDRDLDYEKKVQLQSHFVYLALSSDIKVGVTRASQIPTRWIDQGAEEAIKIAETPNRYLAGITEVALKNHFSDKTSWQKMLKNEIASLDLIQARNRVFDLLPNETKNYFIENAEIVKLDYPVLQYPKKINSLKLNNSKVISGVLKGIKGQYLIFEDGGCFNVRSHEGYQVEITF